MKDQTGRWGGQKSLSRVKDSRKVQETIQTKLLMTQLTTRWKQCKKVAEFVSYESALSSNEKCYKVVCYTLGQLIQRDFRLP